MFPWGLMNCLQCINKLMCILIKKNIYVCYIFSDWELEDVPERRYEIPGMILHYFIDPYFYNNYYFLNMFIFLELEARRQVYSDNLRAVPLSDMNGVFRTFNSDSFG